MENVTICVCYVNEERIPFLKGQQETLVSVRQKHKCQFHIKFSSLSPSLILPIADSVPIITPRCVCPCLSCGYVRQLDNICVPERLFAAVICCIRCQNHTGSVLHVRTQ